MLPYFTSNCHFQTATLDISTNMESSSELDGQITRLLRLFDDYVEANLHITDAEDEQTFNSGGRFRSRDLCDRILGIKHNTHDFVYINPCSYTPFNWLRLACILKQNTMLKRLTVNGQMSDGHMKSGLFLCSGLRSNRSINELNLYDMKLSIKPTRFLGDFFTENNLEKIVLTRCQI